MGMLERADCWRRQVGMGSLVQVEKLALVKSKVISSYESGLEEI